MVEVAGLRLFLDRPVAWCFLRGMKYLSILMVGVALLVGGCGEKPTDKPAREIYTNSSQAISQFDIRDEGLYVKGETEPFTGMVIECRKDGSKLRETPFVNGKEHGTAIRYFEGGGGKASEIVYEHGKKISQKAY
tara:strand:- start:251 stop:655 length:405 start_codon:yes stop_codon:yes gene_type:complete